MSWEVAARDLAPGQWDTVVENLGLVRFVVNRMGFTDPEQRADAEQDGVFGLLRAVQKYDPDLEGDALTAALLAELEAVCDDDLDRDLVAVALSGESTVELAERYGRSRQCLLLRRRRLRRRLGL